MCIFDGMMHYGQSHVKLIFTCVFYVNNVLTNKTKVHMYVTPMMPNLSILTRFIDGRVPGIDDAPMAQKFLPAPPAPPSASPRQAVSPRSVCDPERLQVGDARNGYNALQFVEHRLQKTPKHPSGPTPH